MDSSTGFEIASAIRFLGLCVVRAAVIMAKLASPRAIAQWAEARYVEGEFKD